MTVKKHLSVNSVTWVRSHLAMWLVGCVGVLFSLTAFWVSNKQLQHNTQTAFAWASHDRSSTVQKGLSSGLEAVRDLHQLFMASAPVSRETFQFVAQRILARHGVVQTLEWIPRVPHSQRATYEAQARAVAPHFQITERDAHGTLVRAKEREVYFPVYFLAPWEDNAQTLGFDLGSHAQRRAALEKARDTDSLVISERITLIQGTNQTFGFLALHPVYGKGLPATTRAERRQNLRGFVLGVFAIGPLVETSIAHLEPRGVDFLLLDEDADGDKVFLYSHASRKRPASSANDDNISMWYQDHIPQISTTIQVADRTWRFTSAQTPFFRTPKGFEHTPWIALGSGLLLTTLLLSHLRRLQLNLAERRRAEMYTEGILTSLADALVVLSPQGLIKRVNPAVCELLQHHSDDLIDRPVSQLYDPKHEGNANLDALIRTGAFHSREATLITKSGATVPVLLSGSALYDVKEMRTDTVLVATNITEHKRAERKIVQLSRAVEQSPVSIIITDTQGAIEYVNPEFSKVTGYTQNDVRGQNPRIWQSGNTPSAFYDHLWQTVLSGNVWRGEIENKKKNGTLYWEFASISPVRNSRGTIINLIAIKEDITDHKRMEHELLRAKELAEAGNRAKTEFLSVMSHELRTPLNAVLGFSELLSLSALDTEQQETVSKISRSGHTLLNILDDILTLSQIECHGIKIQKEPFHLPSLIQAVVHSVEDNAHKKGIALTQTIAPDLPPVLAGNAKQLRLILLNVLGNAIKFTNQGRVEISVEYATLEGQRMVHFSIEDTGIGIQREKQHIIFQPFTQVDASNVRAHGGTGLGLTVCQRLVELMQGHIRIDSTFGLGSIFHIYIPLQPGKLPDKPIQPASAIPAAIVPSEAHILVVEDDPINQMVTKKLLNRLGFQVELAENGQQALTMCADTPFDLILMDCMMPTMDGFTATRTLRERKQKTGHGHRIPILALTALSKDDAWERCREAGMDDYISKPVNLDTMRALLTHWLTEHQSLADGTTREPTTDRLCVETLRQEMGADFDPVVTLFLESLPKRLTTIRQACTSPPSDKLKAEVYALTGACLQLGMKKLANLSMELLEAPHKEEITEGVRSIKKRITALEREAKQVTRFLRGKVQKS